MAQQDVDNVAPTPVDPIPPVPKSKPTGGKPVAVPQPSVPPHSAAPPSVAVQQPSAAQQPPSAPQQPRAMPAQQPVEAPAATTIPDASVPKALETFASYHDF